MAVASKNSVKAVNEFDYKHVPAARAMAQTVSRLFWEEKEMWHEFTNTVIQKYAQINFQIQVHCQTDKAIKQGLTRAAFLKLRCLSNGLQLNSHVLLRNLGIMMGHQ
jgi:hypothetical protein